MVPGAEERTVGLLLPTREQAMAGVWDAARLLDIAARAETLGFDATAVLVRRWRRLRPGWR